MRKRVHEVLDGTREGDIVSRAANAALLLLIALNVLALVAETLPGVYAWYPAFFEWFEFASVLLFSAEYVTALRVAEPITVDGRLDEDAWKRALLTPPFARPDGGAPDERIRTQARLAWDDTCLYVGFFVKDDDLWNPRTERDGPLWEHDVVEVYLDPGADGRDYVEIQVSPANVVFDAWFDRHRTPPWHEAARRLDIGLRSAVHAAGSVNVRDDGVEDRGWTVELAVPFAELSGLSGPPREGDRWQLNLFRLDSRGAGTMGNQAAWMPVGGDFHDLTRAGHLVFRHRPAPPLPTRARADRSAENRTPSLAAPLTAHDTPSLIRSQHRETVLGEVPVVGERVGDAEAAHELEARAVDQAEPPLAGEELRRGRSVVQRPFDVEHRDAAEDLHGEDAQRLHAEAPLHEGVRLQDDVVRGGELRLGVREPRPRVHRPLVPVVVCVQEGEKGRCVHEDGHPAPSPSRSSAR